MGRSQSKLRALKNFASNELLINQAFILGLMVIV